MKVLVVGATGSSAGMVVPELVRRGVAVRGLVRSPEQRAAAHRAGATETAVADLNDLDGLLAAADGVEGMFGIIPAFAEGEAGIGVNMVRAASRAGVRKFVFSSVYHPSSNALSNHQGKQPAEEALYDSDLDFTILQPAIFMQQIAGLWHSARRTGTISAPYSADARMAYVDYSDVAAVAAAAFLDDRFSYGTFELAAPGMFTRHDLAALIGDALGTRVTAESSGLDWGGGSQLPPGLLTMMKHYDQHGFHGGNSLVLAAMLGRPPVTVPDFIARLARS